MQSEQDSEFENINRKLVKLKWQITSTFMGLLALQLVIFVLLLNAVTGESSRAYADWKQDYRLGVHSSNEQKMIDNLEGKMVLELKKIQDQTVKLNEQE
jgi:hypothetical protein